MICSVKHVHDFLMENGSQTQKYWVIFRILFHMLKMG